MDFETRQTSKASRFFEWLFAIVIINLITIVLSIFIITLLPAHVASYATISEFKENGTNRIIRKYFSNFMKYVEKAFLIGILIIVISVIAVFSMNFYKNKFDVESTVGQVGYWIMLLVLFVILLLSLHIPLLVIKFPKLNIIDTIKISMFICFRYILSTITILVCDILMIVGVLALPIWVFIGFTIPMVVVLRFTEPTYYYLRKINIEEIIEKSKEIEDEDNFRD